MKKKNKHYDIREIFEQMELDLISSMHRAFYFHKREEAKEGFSWEQWQKSKLRSIEKYRKRNKKIVNSYSKPIQETINRELKGGFKKERNNEIKIKAAIGDLPETINADISKINVSEALRVKDLVLGDKVEILTDKELPLVTVSPAR